MLALNCQKGQHLPPLEMYNNQPPIKESAKSVLGPWSESPQSSLLHSAKSYFGLFPPVRNRVCTVRETLLDLSAQRHQIAFSTLHFGCFDACAMLVGLQIKNANLSTNMLCMLFPLRLFAVAFRNILAQTAFLTGATLKQNTPTQNPPPNPASCALAIWTCQTPDVDLPVVLVFLPAFPQRLWIRCVRDTLLSN